jgi:hypothetical protein
MIGNPDQLVTDHLVKIVGLSPDTSYHYQLKSKAKLGPVAQSKDFIFKTKPEALEVISFNTETLSPQKANFSWLTSQETNSQLSYVPYRNGKISYDELKTVTDNAMTTSHEIAVADLEAGVVYQVDLSGVDKRGKKITKVINFFSTTKDDLPPVIDNIQTESALSQGKDAKVQTIVTWTTNEPTQGQIKYAKGIVEDETLFNEETPMESSFDRKHTAVITKFEVGEVYTFRILATDSGGNTTISSVHTILTPKQKEGVFELILNTFETTFGWLGKMK